MTHFSRHHLRPLLFIAVATLLCGCVEIDTVVKLRPDGGAVVTERLAFSQGLLDLDDKAPAGGKRLKDLLTREAALERMKHMGKGIRLVSHKVEEGPNASQQSVTVFEIDDIAELCYASPLLAYADYSKNNIVKVHFEPVYIGTWWGRRAGDIAVAFRPLTTPERQPQVSEDQPLPPGPSPRQLQVLRDLGPVFRDIAKDVKFKLTFESYGPLRGSGIGHRGSRAGAIRADLIDFSADDLDRYGGLLLENEEVMLDLLQKDLGSQDVVDHVQGFVNNLTLAVFLPAGSPYAGGFRDEIYVRPSPELFKRHFQGKDITFYYEKGPQRTRPATFAEIGQKEVDEQQGTAEDKK